MHKSYVPLVSLFLASIGPLFGQFDTGAVLGTVYDASHAPVSSAIVTMEEVHKGVSVSSRTRESGTYEFLSIPIGRYKVRVDQPGFRTQSSGEFELTIGARQRVDFSLELSSVQSSVEVTADVSILQTDNSDRG